MCHQAILPWIVHNEARVRHDTVQRPELTGSRAVCIPYLALWTIPIAVKRLDH